MLKAHLFWINLLISPNSIRDHIKQEDNLLDGDFASYQPT
jgi:hypothetical protein